MKAISQLRAWVVAAMVATATTATAQGTGGYGMAGQVAEPQERFDLKLSGATVGELVEVAQARTGSHLNIVVPAEHVGIPVPDLDLRQVTFGQVSRMLAHATRNSEQYLFFEEVDGGWVFQTQPGRTQSTERVRSWVIEDLLEHYELDDILALLHTTLEMEGSPESVPAMQLHQETRALLGRFEDRQAQVVDQLLNQLRQNRARGTGPTPEKLREQIERLEMERVQAEHRLAELLDERAMIALRIAAMEEEGAAEEAARLAAKAEAMQVQAELLKQQIQQFQREQMDLRMRIEIGVDGRRPGMNNPHTPGAGTRGGR